MSETDYSRLTKFFEGFRPKPYKDTVGKKTVGYGFNLTDPDISSLISSEIASGKKEMSKEEADKVFKVIYERASSWAKNYMGEAWDTLSPIRQAVLTDMAYNMGPRGLQGFTKLKEALQQGDYKGAAREMKNSKWYEQVKQRGIRNVSLMEEGL